MRRGSAGDLGELLLHLGRVEERRPPVDDHPVADRNATLDDVNFSGGNLGDINFTGFGKFSTSNRAARQGENPRTGERVQIPATTVPKFSAGSSLKGAVKG